MHQPSTYNNAILPAISFPAARCFRPQQCLQTFSPARIDMHPLCWSYKYRKLLPCNIKLPVNGKVRQTVTALYNHPKLGAEKGMI